MLVSTPREARISVHSTARFRALASVFLVAFGLVWAGQLSAQTTPVYSVNPSPVCMGSTGVTFSISSLPGERVHWVFEKDPSGNSATQQDNGSIVGGSDSTAGGDVYSIRNGIDLNSITINFTSPNATSVTRFLRVYTTLGGATGTATVHNITINPVPAAPGATSGSAFTQCSGATGVTYTTTGNPANFWSITGGTASITAGGSSATVTVSVGTSNFTLNAYQIAGGCTSTVSSQAITVNAIPATPGAISGSAFTQCSGATGLTYTSTGANFWAIVGGSGASITAGGTTATATVSVGTANFTLEAYTITAGCTSLVSSQAITVPNPAQPGSITGTATQTCGTTGVAFASTGANFWVVNGGSGASIASGQGTANVTVDVGSANFTLESYQITAGCTSAVRSQAITVTGPAQSGTITGTFTQTCGATGVVYGSTLANYWAIVGGSGASITAGGTTASVTVQVGSANFTLEAYTITGGCTSAVRSQAITVNPPAQPAAITGTATQTCGSTGVAYASAGANYWAIVGGSGASIAGGQGTASVTVDVGTVNFTLQAYTIAGTCTSTVRTQAITVGAASPGAVTGTATQFCGATGVAFSSTGANFWDISGGAGASIAGGQGTASVTVDVGTASFTLRSYTIAAGCTSAATTQAITVNPPVQSGAITGTFTQLCGTTGVVYGSTLANYWVIVGGAGASITAGGTTANVTVSVGTANFTLEAYTIAGGCTSAVRTQAITVNPPLQPGVIAGAAFTQCSGTTGLVYTSTSSTFWEIAPLTGTFSTAPSVVGAAGSATVSVGVTAAGGTFSLRAFQVAGGCTSTVRVQTITVNPIPAQSGTITAGAGGFTKCTGQTGLTFTSTTANYWQLTSNTSGASITAGGTTATLTIDAGATAGSVTLEAYNIALGCTSVVRSQVVTVEALPSQTAVITGTFTRCSGSGNTAFTSTGANFWTITGVTGMSTAPTIFSGGATATVTVDVGATTFPTNGSFTVNAFSTTANCTSLVRSQVITVNATPPTPTAISFSPTVAQCVDGTNTVVYSVTTAPANTFNWTIPVGTGTIIESGTTTYSAVAANSITVRWNALASGTNQITRTVDVSRTLTGCTGGTLSQVVTIRRTPTPVIAGAATIAAGSGNIYGVALEPGNTYLWEVIGNVNVSIVGSPNNRIITMAANLAATGTVTLRQTEVNPGTPNCSTVVDRIISIGCPNFATTISAISTNLCVGDQAVLSIPPTNYKADSTLAWQVSTVSAAGPFSPAPGAIANAQFYNSPGLAAGTYYYRAGAYQAQATGCVPQFSSVITVNVSAAPTIGTLSAASSNICVGFVNRLSVPAGYNGTIQWQLNSSTNGTEIPGGWSAAPGTPQAIPVPTFFDATAFASGNRTALYRARVITSCDTTFSNVLSIEVQDLPSGNITATSLPASSCVGDPLTLAGAVTNAARMTGQWISTNGNGAFSTLTANPLFIAEPSRDPNARWTPNTGAGGQPVTFNWVVSSGNCATAQYTTTTVNITGQPFAAVLYPSGAPNFSPCPNTTTLPIRARAFNGTGRFIILNSIDATTALFRTQNTPPFDFLPIGAYVSTPDTGATVQFVIGPGDAGRTLTLRWQVTNATCTTPNNTDLVFTVAPSGLVGSFPALSFAGACPGEASPSLAATVGGGVVGLWQARRKGDLAQAGGVFIPNNTTPGATFTPAAGDTLGGGVDLFWEISTAGCGTMSRLLSQSLQVSPVPLGFIADTTLNPITICIDRTTPQQDATVIRGTGIWTTTGAGSFLPSATDPRARYQPAAADSNRQFTIVWRITNGFCVAPDTNSRIIKVNATSKGGFTNTAPIDQCPGTLTPPLGAVVTSPSIGIFTFRGGTGQSGFSGAVTDGNARFLAALADTGRTVTIKWTATNGVCTVDSNLRVVNVRQRTRGSVVTDTFGTKYRVAETRTTLPLGGRVRNGIGRWVAPANLPTPLFGTFSSTAFPGDPRRDSNAVYTAGIGDAGGLAQRTVSLIWRVTNFDCDSVDYVRLVTVYARPVGRITSTQPFVCVTEGIGQPTPVEASIGAGNKGQWFSTGSGSFAQDTLTVTTYTPSPSDANTTVTLRWRVTSQDPSLFLDSIRTIRVHAVNATVSFIDANEDTVCLSGLRDSARFQATGGALYRWSGSTQFLSSTTVSNPVFAGTGVTRPAVNTLYTYLVTVTDPLKGTCEDTDTLQVYVTDGGVATIDTVGPEPSSPDTVCLDFDFPITVNVAGAGVTPAAYFWSVTGTNGTVSNPTAQTATGRLVRSGTTRFNVLVTTNPGSCTIFQSKDISNFNVPNAQPILSSPATPGTCPDEQIQPIFVTGVSGCANVAWFRGTIAQQRALGALAFTTTSANPTFIKMGPPGSIFDTLMTTRGGIDPSTGKLTTGIKDFCVACFYPAACRAQDSITYSVLAQPRADFYGRPTAGLLTDTSSKNVKVPFFQSRVEFTAVQPNPPLTTDINVPTRELKIYLWDFGEPDSLNPDSNRAVTPTAGHTYLKGGSFTVTLYIADTIGCSSVLVRPAFVTVSEPDFFFPTAFSPDGIELTQGVDKTINERFQPLPVSQQDGFDIQLFEIYDKKGNLVFETKDRSGWDGNLTKGGTPADVGVYTFRMQVIFTNQAGSVLRNYSGKFTLLR
jgi:hypothetical protein